MTFCLRGTDGLRGLGDGEVRFRVWVSVVGYLRRGMVVVRCGICSLRVGRQRFDCHCRWWCGLGAEFTEVLQPYLILGCMTKSIEVGRWTRCLPVIRAVWREGSAVSVVFYRFTFSIGGIVPHSGREEAESDVVLLILYALVRCLSLG